MQARAAVRMPEHEELQGTTIALAMGNSWSAYLQTLEGYSNLVNLVPFSYDLARLASASSDATIKIWHTYSGACLHTLRFLFW
jgi:WD40 repeat protein